MEDGKRVGVNADDDDDDDCNLLSKCVSECCVCGTPKEPEPKGIGGEICTVYEIPTHGEVFITEQSTTGIRRRRIDLKYICPEP